MSGGGRTRAVPFVLSVAGAASVGWLLLRRFTRYEVAGESMRPALEPGDYLLVDRSAYARRRPRADEVVLAQDPRQPGRVMVKRVEWVGHGGEIRIAGDNPSESTDSRTFGAVPPESVLGKVVWRYWPLSRAGRVR